MVLTSKFCFRGLHGRLRNKSRREFFHGGLFFVSAENFVRLGTVTAESLVTVDSARCPRKVTGDLDLDFADKLLTVDSHASMK